MRSTEVRPQSSAIIPIPAVENKGKGLLDPIETSEVPLVSKTEHEQIPSYIPQARPQSKSLKCNGDNEGS